MLWNQLSCLGVTLDFAWKRKKKKHTHQYNNNNSNNTEPGKTPQQFHNISHTWRQQAARAAYFYTEKWKMKKNNNLRVLGNKLMLKEKVGASEKWPESQTDQWEATEAVMGEYSRDVDRQQPESEAKWQRGREIQLLSLTHKQECVLLLCRWQELSGGRTFAAVSEDGSNQTANLSFGITRFRPLDRSTWLEQRGGFGG